MTVATLYLDLLVIGCTSGREKCRRMRPIMDKLHQHFNVAVAEVDRDDDPRQARLAVAAIGTTRRARPWNPSPTPSRSTPARSC